MLEVTVDNFKKEILDSEKPAIIDFWAPWCMPCKIIAPIVEALAKDMHGTVKVGKMNVDDHPELATELSILNIPTIIIFKDGKEVSRIIGVNSKEAITAKVRSVIE